MVRIKHRYLLVKILYPSSSLTSPSNAKGSNDSRAAQQHQRDGLNGNNASPSSLLLDHLPAQLQFHAATPDTVTVHDVLKLLRKQLLEVFGEHGAGVAGSGLVMKYWSNATSTFIVRCPRSCASMVWASITYITTLNIAPSTGWRDGKFAKSERDRADAKLVPVVMRVMTTSGTIRKCQEEAIRLARALCGRARGLEVALKGGLTIANEDNQHGLQDDSIYGDSIITDPVKGDAEESDTSGEDIADEDEDPSEADEDAEDD